jgi:O-antigen/teichoic acid export membrane protein
MQNKRQLAINLIASSLAFAIGPGINFILYPYIVKHIGVEAFGFTGLALNFVGYAQLITIALNSMAGRFITIKIHENDYDAANRYMNSVFWANLISGLFILVCSVACIYYLERLVKVPQNILIDVKVLFAFTFLSFFLNVMDSTFGVGVFSSNRLDISAGRDILTSILRASVLFVLYRYFSPKVAYIGIATFIMNAAIIITDIVFTVKLLPQIKISRKFFDIKAMYEVASAGVWNVFGKLGNIFSQGLDLLIANLFISAAAMGVISLSKTIPIVVMSVLVMIANVFAPQMTISYAHRDIEDVKKQVKFSMKMIGMVVAVPVAIMLIYGNEFYGLWVPSQNPELLKWLTFVNMGGLIISGTMQGLSNVFTLVNRIKRPVIINFVVNTLNIALVFLFLHFEAAETGKMFIIIGVNAVLGIIWNLTFVPIYAAKCLNFKWNEFYSEIARNILSFILIACALMLVKKCVNIKGWTGFLSLCTVAGFVGISMNVFIMFTKEERGKMIRIFKQKIFRAQE